MKSATLLLGNPSQLLFSLLTISGSLEASHFLRKDGHKAEHYCIDTERNLVVESKMCTAGCCIFRQRLRHQSAQPTDIDQDSQDESSSNPMPYCGTQLECDAQERTYHHDDYSHTQSTSPPPKANQREIPALVAGVGMFFAGLAVATKFYRDSYELKQRLKQRETEVFTKLDSKFPPTLYASDEDSDFCCICLDDFEGTIVRKLGCGHIMHQKCFDQWCMHSSNLVKKRVNQICPDESQWSCPLCKRSVMPFANEAPIAAVTLVEEDRVPAEHHLAAPEDQQQCPLPALVLPATALVLPGRVSHSNDRHVLLPPSVPGALTESPAVPRCSLRSVSRHLSTLKTIGRVAPKQKVDKMRRAARSRSSPPAIYSPSHWLDLGHPRAKRQESQPQA